MDDEFEQLEAELRRLRPTAASAALQRAIAGKLARGPRARVVRYAWLALPAAALAILLTMATRATRPGLNGKRAVAGPAFKPVAAENVVLMSADEGDVTLADGTRARRVRRAYLDTITWKNPRTNASLTWTVPREEVRVTPVNFQ